MAQTGSVGRDYHIPNAKLSREKRRRCNLANWKSFALVACSVVESGFCAGGMSVSDLRLHRVKERSLATQALSRDERTNATASRETSQLQSLGQAGTIPAPL
jgi:hypothetical protein